MTTSLRRRLLKRRREIAESTSERLLNGDDADHGKATAELATIASLLSALPEERPYIIRKSLTVGFVCVLLTGVAWAVPVSLFGARTTIALSVEASAIEIDLTDDWTLPVTTQVVSSRIQIEDATLSLTNPDLAPLGFDHATKLSVEADRARLQDLSIGDGSRLAFDGGSGLDVRLSISKGVRQGKITFNGGGKLSATDPKTNQTTERRFELEVPEDLSFERGEKLAVPTSLIIEPEDPIEIQNIVVSRIRFGQPSSVDDEFVSTIRDGSLRLPETAASLDVLIGDKLAFDDLAARVTTLRIAPDSPLSLDLEGEARRISLTQAGYERDLTPNLLSFLYHSQPIALLFGALSFLWLTAWGLLRGLGR